jgi:hypothetical protein
MPLAAAHVRAGVAPKRERAPVLAQGRPEDTRWHENRL